MPDDELDVQVDEIVGDDVDFLSRNDSDEDEGEEKVEEKTEEKTEEKEEKKEEEVKKDAEEEKQEEEKHEEKPRVLSDRYKQVFKELPELRAAFFEAKEFKKLYPSVDDAKDAFEKAQNFDFIESSLTEGELDDFFVALEESKSLNKVAGNFLPALYKRSQDLYFKVTDPIIESALQAAYREGINHENDNLKNAALHMAKLFFGDPEIAKGKKTQTETKDPEFEKEKKEFAEQRHAEAVESVSTQARDKLLYEVSKHLENLPPYLKKLISTEVLNEVDSALAADKTHITQMEGLWAQARRNRYSRDSLARITSTYLARAKQIIPGVTARAKAQVSKTEKQQTKPNVERMPVGGGAPKGSKTNKAIDWNKTTDQQYLDGKITYKS